MKGVLYFTDILALVSEFQKFIGYRLINIYDVDDHIYLMKLKDNEKNNIYIYIKPGSYIFQTEIPTEKRRKLPTTFCTRLRKFLNNKRISNISTYKQDRIIRIYFGVGTTYTNNIISFFNKFLCYKFTNITRYPSD